jgi:hypothetical protein
MLNTREPSEVSAKGKGEARYQTGFVRWRAADEGFTGWSLDGVILNASKELEFASTDQATDPYAAGSYNGGNYYNGGSFFVGEATSPIIQTAFDYKEAIASWNASTPGGTWVEILFRAGYGERWSKWYTLGIWASGDTTIQRHSVQSQGDADGFVAVDTFVSSNKKQTTNKFQLRLRLFSEDGVAKPTIRNASIAYSTSAPKSAGVSTGNPARWNKVLSVPECSQMIYPGGGEVWCSPTSTSMVLGYWDPTVLDPNSPLSPCEQQVHASVDGVFDWIYDGHGNWPFNTAYAATQGYEAYVARFTSLEKAEDYIAEGVPIVMSIAWGKGDLTGVHTQSSNGHLLVLVGFDASGNPIVNDPDSADDASVQRTYLRSEFEPLWLQASAGTVYLIYPSTSAAPPLP